MGFINLNTLHVNVPTLDKPEILKQIYQESLRYIMQIDPQSTYAFFFLNNTHEYGPIDNIMPPLKQVDKGSQMNSLEQICIDSHYYHNEFISEKLTGERSACTRWHLALITSHQGMT